MRPGLVAGLFGLAGGVVSVVASGVTPAATAVGLVGIALFAAGAVLDRGAVVILGGLLLGTATVLAGHAGVGAVPLVVATVGAVLAYDQFDTARTTRRAFDSEARTARGEAAQAMGVTLTVGLVGLGAAVVYRLAADQQSTLAAAALLVGATSLTAAVYLEG